MTGNRRGVRVLRGFLLAGFSTFVAAFSHAIGGGGFPHPTLLVAGIVFSGILCTALAGGGSSLTRIVPSVAVSQAGFHLLFSVSGSSGVRLVDASGHASHAADHVPTVLSAGHVMLPGDPMLASHIVAAVVTILAVRFGEAGLSKATDAARLAFTALLRLPRAGAVPIARARAVAASAPLIAPRLPEFLHCVDHRGPPATSAVATR